MKRSALGIVVLALAAWGFAGVGSSLATHCSPATGGGEPPHDPFGSCEDENANFGNVRCGAGDSTTTRVDVPMVGTLLVENGSTNKGVQACNDDGATAGDPTVTPVQGRVSVVDHAGGTTVASDGDDKDNTGGTKSWTRLDANPNSSSGCDLRERRSGGGQWWRSGGGTSTPDGAGQAALADNCIIP